MSKRVLVLGGAGFIGSYLVRELLGHGYTLTIVDNFSKYGYLEHDFFKHPVVRLEIKDVRALYPVDFKGYDIVLCLAALIGGIQYFHRIPYRIARDNNEILTHAIDCTLAACPEALFVYFSSSMVYERVQEPVTEAGARNQLVPFTNYGMQKLYGEYLVTGAARELGLRDLVIRPFNAVGSGELPMLDRQGQVAFGMAHVIPDFVYKALIGQDPFEILGDGEQVRTFTHARDIAEATVLALEKATAGENFNFCGAEPFKIRDLAVRIWQKVNPDKAMPRFRHLEAPAADVRFRVGYSHKAREQLGWQPRFGVEAILDDCIEYVRLHRDQLLIK
ncbi:NAD-dependent epimerase/dehydratase family protein [Thiorhodovibrio frisius]|uniref:Nucleoside-diphosphate-sugar epimerase n=1 Tax=Thiorhodovibrio frisius TaxID=631362 RepID=H8Z0C1_9GAMM|nr:NAD(P)-dependent oxidoreductase [Thiorhodovibrio frisius]EIC22329.1 nucleoside-diphosphate-sugar epimerase [Thiorhodovibrio frisius]WPL24626.1 UDP-glucose 4-epimerase [Thiorhodovibrio frisius]